MYIDCRRSGSTNPISLARSATFSCLTKSEKTGSSHAMHAPLYLEKAPKGLSPCFVAHRKTVSFSRGKEIVLLAVSSVGG
ncbi:MAG: hypothetical protein Ct9H90mP5_01520 [Acidimicrobiaceae bacterium]|nr:MAG: hypothetical protein Ct9H90mP5_01520 [Acidimicrobiaceae bacterium]